MAAYNTLGITVVLKYRVHVGRAAERQPAPGRCSTQRAITVRSRAEEWGIDPQRISYGVRPERIWQ